jgi:catechol 2,3-dioxygenase-like lactoylglutathione lyase family enzyme
MSLELSMVGVIVEDMPRALAFYRQLGLEIPSGSDQLAHVEVPMGALTFFLNAKSSNARWDPSRSEPAGGYRVILEFFVDGEAAVDAKYNDLTAAGYVSHAAPYDVTAEMRFALVDDPDGNTILLSGRKPDAPIVP